jgi:uncharacterized protein
VSGTADPSGAKAHARAMADRQAEAMPTVPARHAKRLPLGVEPGDCIWEETVPGGGYATRRLARGARLRITDLAGDACVSLLLFNAENPVERLNVADTIKVQWNAYLGPGKLLLSDMGRVLASILEDTAGGHDCFAGASNAASAAARYGGTGNHSAHPNARDRFLTAVGRYGLGRKDVHPCVNFFKPVRVAADGGLAVDVGPFAPERQITLRLEMDVILIIANCAHVLDPRPDYRVTPAHFIAWRGPVTPEDDEVRNATPEGQRAFLNTEDYYQR